VEKEEMEFELQFSSGQGGYETYHVHVRCFAAWELERRNGDSNGKLPCANGGGMMSGREHNGTGQDGGPG
jgi:hypothetical protein